MELSAGPVPDPASQPTFTSRTDQPVISFSAPVDVEDGRWLVLRVTDPTAVADARAPDAFRAAGSAIAYASPFFLDPDRVPAPTGG